MWSSCHVRVRRSLGSGGGVPKGRPDFVTLDPKSHNCCFVSCLAHGHAYVCKKEGNVPQRPRDVSNQRDEKQPGRNRDVVERQGGKVLQPQANHHLRRKDQNHKLMERLYRLFYWGYWWMWSFVLVQTASHVTEKVVETHTNTVNYQSSLDAEMIPRTLRTASLRQSRVQLILFCFFLFFVVVVFFFSFVWEKDATKISQNLELPNMHRSRRVKCPRWGLGLLTISVPMPMGNALLNTALFTTFFQCVHTCTMNTTSRNKCYSKLQTKESVQYRRNFHSEVTHLVLHISVSPLQFDKNSLTSDQLGKVNTSHFRFNTSSFILQGTILLCTRTFGRKSN